MWLPPCAQHCAVALNCLLSFFLSSSLPAAQVQASEVRRAKLAAEKAAADDKAAAVAGRLPELEAEKRAAAAKKVCTECRV
jgi:hypothetical protein